MTALNIEIKEGTLEQVVALSQQIPEFIDPHPLEEYQKRLMDKVYLILIVYVNQQAAGFKVGYQRVDYFYSWMGAILPRYRRMNLATLLAERQEAWAKTKGYTRIVFKTRNYLKPMLLFALKRGFNIISVEKRETVEAYRILLQKKLTN